MKSIVSPAPKRRLNVSCPTNPAIARLSASSFSSNSAYPDEFAVSSPTDVIMRYGAQWNVVQQMQEDAVQELSGILRRPTPTPPRKQPSIRTLDLSHVEQSLYGDGMIAPSSPFNAYRFSGMMPSPIDRSHNSLLSTASSSSFSNLNSSSTSSSTLAYAPLAILSDRGTVRKAPVNQD